MASATAKPQKRLAEFLKEQQEPFILDLYLLERGCSKKWSFNGDSGKKNLERSASTSSGLSKKRKALLPFSKVLTALHKKLASHNENGIATRDSYNQNGDEDVIVSVPELPGRSVKQIAVETERFSSASSSTVFHSCSDIEEETSLPSPKHNSWFSSADTCQASNVRNNRLQSEQDTNEGHHHQRCIGGSPVLQSQNNETGNQDVGGMEQRTRSCGVLLPKKITEDSLLSAALWGLLIQSANKESYSISMELRELLGPNVSQILKSKRVMHKTKQLLFDCVREITVTLPRKDERQQGYNKQLMRPEELGKLICERTKEWGQECADETNLTNLLTSDYLNSINEWGKFEPHAKAISVQIADAIFECANNEIVSEMIEILPPATQQC